MIWGCSSRFSTRKHDEHGCRHIGKGAQGTDPGKGLEGRDPEQIDHGAEHQAAGGIADKKRQGRYIQPPGIGIVHVREDQASPQLDEPHQRPCGHDQAKNGQADFFGNTHFHTSFRLGGR
jgi:hypothetical protein